MTNCAMMSVDYRTLTLWQYQAMLHEWNERHSQEGGKSPPDPEKMARLKRAMDAHSIH
jgi:hypothetical protein